MRQCSRTCSHFGSILIAISCRLAELGGVQENADGVVDSMAIKFAPLFSLSALATLLNLSPSYLGPYVFTRTLLQLLESTTSLDGADVRIINVSHVYTLLFK